MRVIKVPLLKAIPQLFVEGPVLPFAATTSAALNQLDGALADLPRLDAELGREGWTVLWCSHVFHKPISVKAWLWCARSERAVDLMWLIARRLKAGGFRVVYKAPRDADPDLLPKAVYLRSGSLQLGLDPRTEPMMRAVEGVKEDRADVDPGHELRFGPQRCPSCSVIEIPAALVAGFPTPELLLAAELGEVVFVDGGTVDRDSRDNARCWSCGADFVAR